MIYFIFDSADKGALVIKDDIVAWSWETYKVHNREEFIDDPKLMSLCSDIYFSSKDIIFNSTDLADIPATDIAVLGEGAKILDRTMPRVLKLNKYYQFKVLEIDEDGFELWKELNLK